MTFEAFKVHSGHVHAAEAIFEAQPARDRPARAPGTKRVLVVGDSYTWGYAIVEEEAFPQVAERVFAERGRPDIEVINGGVPDYNSRQERALIQKLLPIYQPDAVVLAYVVNDAEPNLGPSSP